MHTVSPKISIITVCFNSEKYIETTIKSVISQDYPAIEYIVVDGNSGDSTMTIVEKYHSFVAKKISEPDKGIYDAMTKGVAMASGDVVGILNSDDVFASGSIISEVMNIFNTDNTIDALYGNITYFNNDDPGKIVRKWITKPYYPRFFDHGEVPPHPALFVRKRVYDAIGAYFPDFKITSDYEFMLRAFKIHGYKPYFINKFIVNMRMGGESTKSLKNILIGNREMHLAWKMNNLRPPFYFWFLRFYKKVRQFFV